MSNVYRVSALIAILSISGCALFRPAESDVTTAQCPELEVPECPEPTVIEKVVVREVPVEVPAKTPPLATTAGELHLPIIGAVEWARVEPSGIVMEARIDTGAETTSVHAEDIQLIERDGKRYIRFSLLDPSTADKVFIERRLRRRVRIKQQDADSERRYVVKLWLTLGKQTSLVEVSLTDRENFEYPLLVGRNFITDSVIVDVSRQHVLNRPSPPEQDAAPP